MEGRDGTEGGRCRILEGNMGAFGERKPCFGNSWRLTIFLRAGYLQVPGCVRVISERAASEKPNCRQKYGTDI